MRSAREVLDEAHALPGSHEKVAVLEEAVRLADLAQDEELAYEARNELVHAAEFSGEADKAMSAFAWCLAYHDRHPDEVDSLELYWKYKWMLSAARRFPQIPLARLEELHADYARRLQEAGYGARSVPYYRMRLAMHLGDHEAARQAYSAWQFTRQDILSDCEACEADTDVEYQLFQGRDERALEKARPILDGRLSCAHVPHITYAQLLDPLLRLGRVDEARRCHELGYALIAHDDDLLESQGEHLGYLSAVGDLPGAARLYARHVGWVLRSRELEQVVSFWAHTLRWLDALQAAGEAQVALALPTHHPLHRADGVYGVAALLGWHERAALDLTRRFDERNRSDAFTRKLARRRTLGELQPG